MYMRRSCISDTVLIEEKYFFLKFSRYFHWIVLCTWGTVQMFSLIDQFNWFFLLYLRVISKLWCFMTILSTYVYWTVLCQTGIWPRNLISQSTCGKTCWIIQEFWAPILYLSNHKTLLKSFWEAVIIISDLHVSTCWSGLSHSMSH